MYKSFYGGVCFEPKELLENEIKNDVKIEYYKTKNFQNYGVEVIKRTQKFNEVIVEKESIKNVSNDEKITNEIIGVLKRNKVTPIALKEIVTDLLKTDK